MAWSSICLVHCYPKVCLKHQTLFNFSTDFTNFTANSSNKIWERIVWNQKMHWLSLSLSIWFIPVKKLIQRQWCAFKSSKRFCIPNFRLLGRLFSITADESGITWNFSTTCFFKKTIFFFFLPEPQFS